LHLDEDVRRCNLFGTLCFIAIATVGAIVRKKATHLPCTGNLILRSFIDPPS